MLKFTLGPNAQKPVQIPLREMGPAEAAAYATSIFVDVRVLTWMDVSNYS